MIPSFQHVDNKELYKLHEQILGILDDRDLTTCLLVLTAARFSILDGAGPAGKRLGYKALMKFDRATIEQFPELDNRS